MSICLGNIASFVAPAAIWVKAMGGLGAGVKLHRVGGAPNGESCRQSPRWALAVRLSVERTQLNHPPWPHTGEFKG